MTAVRAISTEWLGGFAMIERVGWPTLGGMQFWADVEWRDDWRIQFHVVRHHHRLLDPHQVLRAQGSFEECQSALRDHAPPKNGADRPRVILLHGLIRTRWSMKIMARHLESHGFQPVLVGYPSLLEPLETHAERLRTLIDRLAGSAPIHLVCHSMGGLLARVYLEKGADERIGRVVTIGTPHQGAEKAAKVQRAGLLRWVGPAAEQLVPGHEGIASRIAPNPKQGSGVSFGVIAGGGAHGGGYSFLIPADNDGVVTVESTKLEGADDFLLVRGQHTFLPSLISVRLATEHFLRYGRFETNRPADD